MPKASYNTESLNEIDRSQADASNRDVSRISTHRKVVMNLPALNSSVKQVSQVQSVASSTLGGEVLRPMQVEVSAKQSPKRMMAATAVHRR
jgi:predicted HAD superfamily hydrolase